MELINLGSSIVPAAGSYSREQSSPLYTLVTASGAVEVSSSATSRAAIVESELAAGRAVRVSWLLIKQQGLVSYRQGSKGLL